MQRSSSLQPQAQHQHQHQHQHGRQLPTPASDDVDSAPRTRSVAFLDAAGVSPKHSPAGGLPGAAREQPLVVRAGAGGLGPSPARRLPPSLLAALTSRRRSSVSSAPPSPMHAAYSFSSVAESDESCADSAAAEAAAEAAPDANNNDLADSMMRAAFDGTNPELEYAALQTLLQAMEETPWEPYVPTSSVVEHKSFVSRHSTTIVAGTMLGLIVLIGTLLFRQLEGWSALDACYFTVVTVATLGFGDITPKTSSGRLAVCFFAFVGLAMFGFVLTSLASYSQRKAMSMLSSMVQIESSDPYVAIPRVHRCRWFYALFGTEYLETTSYINQTLEPRWYDPPWELPARAFGATVYSAPPEATPVPTGSRRASIAVTMQAEAAELGRADARSIGTQTAESTSSGLDEHQAANNASGGALNASSLFNSMFAALATTRRIVPIEVMDHDNGKFDDLIGTVDVSVDDFPLQETAIERRYNIEYPPDQEHSNDAPSELILEMRRDLNTLYLRIVGCDNLPVMDRNLEVLTKCSDSVKQFIIAVTMLAAVVLLGALFFHLQERWKYLDAVYFCLISATTIGFGDFAPKTTNGRGFFLLWIFAALGACGYFIGLVQEVTMRSNASESDAASKKPRAKLRRGLRAIAKLLVIVVVCLGSLTIGMKILERWTWFEAFYFAVVCLTTVGYGDLLPSSPTSRVFVMCYSLMGLAALSAFNSILSQLAVDDAEKDVAVLQRQAKVLANRSWWARFRNTKKFQVISCFLTLIFLVAILAIIFHHTERHMQFPCAREPCGKGMTRLEAAYVAVVSICTIGFGDFSPRTVGGRSAFIVFIFLSIFTVSHALFLIQKGSAEFMSARVGKGKRAHVSLGTPAHVRARQEREAFMLAVREHLETKYRPPEKVFDPERDTASYTSGSTSTSSSSVSYSSSAI